MATVEQLEKIIGPICRENNIYLVELKIKGSTRRPVYQVFVETDQGVTLNECEHLSRKIQDALDMDEHLVNEYRLDVSSPGIDRNLIYDFDFRKNIGKKLKVVLKSGKQFKGILTGFDEKTLEMEIENEKIHLERKDIDKAKVQIQW